MTETGKKISDKRKKRKLLLGYLVSPKTRKKISLTLKRLYQEGKKKPICNTGRTRFKKGAIPWNKGKHPKYLQGKNHPNWKGGVKRKHYGTDYNQRRIFRQELQKQVFERDNYTCQICGVRGVDLQVDHIQSWAEYIELRFNIENCRTLCVKCHYKITFGKPMPPTVRAWGHNLFKGGKYL